MHYLSWWLLLLVFISEIRNENIKKPNIILILADDLGINDVSWNNPSSSTPHLSSLATSSSATILDNAYTLPVCTPSRAALMSGTYPFKLGLQRGFGKHSPEGLPLNTTLLPQHLKREGYSTHGFGKWHLGFCSESYTPLKRGFDSYYGLFVGDDEEHTQTRGERRKNRERRSYRRMTTSSMKKKENIKDWSSKNQKIKGKGNYKQKGKQKKYYSKKKKGYQKVKQSSAKKKQKQQNDKKINQKSVRKPTKFGSDIYGSKAIQIIKSANKTTPFFIYLALLTKSYPREVAKRRGNMERAVADNRRKKLSEMDKSVAEIVRALKSSGHYSNTVIFFISDNGARATTDNSDKNNPNYPLRGSKGTVYEGGTKVPAFIHFPPYMKMKNKRYGGLFHMVDTLPTLLALAGGKQVPGIDGVSQLEAMNTNKDYPRTSMVYNIDDNFVPAVLDGPRISQKFQIALREGSWKLVWGQPRMLHRSYRDAKSNGGLVVDDQVLELYNLEKDPGETNNLAMNRMDMVLKLKSLALNHYRDVIPPRFMGLQTTNKVLDYQADFGGLSGWCRAVVTTHCGPLDRKKLYRDLGSGYMMGLFYGTVPGRIEKTVTCVNTLE